MDATQLLDGVELETSFLIPDSMIILFLVMSKAEMSNSYASLQKQVIKKIATL